MLTIRAILLLCLATVFSACREETALERLRKLPLTETSNGKEGVGSAQSPIDEEFFGVRFQQKGLEITDANMFVTGGERFFSGDTVLPTDTVSLLMIVRGWQAKNGLARNKFSTVMRRPDGTIAYQSDDFKMVRTLHIDSLVPGTQLYFRDVDTTLPYYDCEFTVTDAGNGRSVSGNYRVCLKQSGAESRASVD